MCLLFIHSLTVFKLICKQYVLHHFHIRDSVVLPRSPRQTGRPPGEEGQLLQAAAGPEDLPGGTWSYTAWPTHPPLG